MAHLLVISISSDPEMEILAARIAQGASDIEAVEVTTAHAEPNLCLTPCATSYSYSLPSLQNYDAIILCLPESLYTSQKLVESLRQPLEQLGITAIGKVASIYQHPTQVRGRSIIAYAASLMSQRGMVILPRSTQCITRRPILNRISDPEDIAQGHGRRVACFVSLLKRARLALRKPSFNGKLSLGFLV